jgi:hypothetical protein
MRPVEQAIRTNVRAPVILRTIGQSRPFELHRIDSEGIVLLLGAQRAWTRISWECLEGIPAYLRRQGGWVKAGGMRSIDSEPGTLDAYLKGCLNRGVANWLVVVLRDAKLVHVDEGPPLRLRLR